MQRQLELRRAGGELPGAGAGPLGEAEDLPGERGRSDEREDTSSSAAGAGEDVEAPGPSEQVGPIEPGRRR